MTSIKAKSKQANPIFLWWLHNSQIRWMGSLQSHGQRKPPVQLEPSDCGDWCSNGGWALETLFLPCTYLAACCSFSSRGCVPFPSYIWWCHNLSFSVAFLTALLSLCYRVQSCSVRHLGLGGQQANWFCHCLSAAQAAGKLCVVLGEV